MGVNDVTGNESRDLLAAELRGQRPTMAGLAADIARQNAGDDSRVVNLAYYRIKKSLKEEGFDLITDQTGKLTLVLRVSR